MRIAAAVLAASAIALAVTGCSSTDDSSGSTATTTTNVLDRASSAVSSAAGAAQGAISSAQGAATSLQSAASSVVDRAHSAMDNVKSGTFTTAFKTGFPGLAEGRDDAAIEDIYAQTCAAIHDNVDEATVVSEIQVRAGNKGTEATPEQAQQIYNLAKPLC